VVKGLTKFDSDIRQV